MTNPSANPSSKQNPTSQFPPFPQDVICGLARDFINLYDPIREVPRPFLWLGFSVYFGNAISTVARLNTDYSEPRVFGVAIGQSGRAKTSTANNLAQKLFQRALGDSKQHAVEGFGSAEGLLTDLSHHKGIPTVVHLDEVNILAQKTAIDGSVGISALNKLFEDDTYD